MLWFRRIVIAFLALSVAAVIVFWETALFEPRKKITHLFFENVVRYFPFTKENSLKEWEEKRLAGRTVYRIEDDGKGGHYVKAESKDSASALYYKITLDPKKHPILMWKWRVIKFPKKRHAETLSSKREEDFAARIYVIFPAAFFTNSKAIEYIWAELLSAGTSGDSAYTKKIKVLVLRSGGAGADWVSEERDVCEDYRKLFGEEPRLNIGAISFMTDSDSTDTEATSSYAEIKVVYKNEPKI